MTVRILPSLKRTAWHEAGHAVAAWVLGFEVTAVSIEQMGESFSRSTHGPGADCSIAEERARENTVAMAGWFAELASDAVSEGGATYDNDDLSGVRSRIVEHAGDEQIEAELVLAEREAERIIRTNLERVKRLADALLDRTELTNPEEIRSIIQG